jgi:hypothetical protein
VPIADDFKDREDAPVCTSVHPPETSLLSDGICQDDIGSAWRHSGWKPLRTRTWAALRSSPISTAALMRFASCGCNAYVIRSRDDPPKYRIVGNACRSRWCVPCSNARAGQVARVVASRLGADRARFLTLTAPHSDIDLRVQLDTLYAAFARLLRMPDWRAFVRGGIAFLEVVWSEATGQWHPHIHILAHGRYFPHSVLKALWSAAYPGASIVDIRTAGDGRQTARYVTKYASKGVANAARLDHHRLVESISALHRRRTIRTFGDWRGLRLSTDDDTDGWEYVGDLESIVRNAARGDERSAQIVHCLNRSPDDIPIEWSLPPPRLPSPVAAQMKIRFAFGA